MSDTMHKAMTSVLEGMGRAAREGRARRFTNPKRPTRGVEVAMGEVELKPTKGADVEVDPVKEAGMTPEEMDELNSQLEVQR